MKIFELFDDKEIGTATKGGFVIGRELWKGISGQGTSSYKNLKRELSGNKIQKKNLKIDSSLSPKDRFNNLISRVYDQESLEDANINIDDLKSKIYSTIKNVQKINDKNVAKDELQKTLNKYRKYQLESNLTTDEQKAFKELAGIK